MKPRQLIIYLIIFVLLGGFYLAYDLKFKEKKEALDKGQTSIFQIKNDQIDGIRLNRKAESILMERAGKGDWVIKEPLETKAVSYKIQNILVQGAAAEKVRVFIDGDKELAEYGLDNPIFELTFYSKSKPAAPTLLVGAKSPVGGVHYARLADDREVFTILTGVFDMLNVSLNDLRSKDLVQVDESEIDGIMFSGSSDFELKKTGFANWKFVRPVDVEADAVKVNELISRGLKGQVKKFKKFFSEQEKEGFDNSPIVVKVISGDKTAAELKFYKIVAKDDGSSPEGYWVLSSEQTDLMQISTGTFDFLNRGLDELKDKHIVKIKAESVDSIKMTRRSLSLTAKKISGEWKVEKPDKARSNDRDITIFLNILEDLEYVKDMSEGDSGATEFTPARSWFDIELIGANKTLSRIWMANNADDDGNLPIKIEGRGSFMVKAGILKKLPPDFKKKQETKGKATE